MRRGEGRRVRVLDRRLLVGLRRHPEHGDVRVPLTGFRVDGVRPRVRKNTNDPSPSPGARRARVREDDRWAIVVLVSIDFIKATENPGPNFLPALGIITTVVIFRRQVRFFNPGPCRMDILRAGLPNTYQISRHTYSAIWMALSTWSGATSGCCSHSGSRAALRDPPGVPRMLSRVIVRRSASRRSSGCLPVGWVTWR